MTDKTHRLGLENFNKKKKVIHETNLSGTVVVTPFNSMYK